MNEIEATQDALFDAVSAEAESVDRSRANQLRAERSALSDLLTDAECLQRRIDERHKAMLKAELSAAMTAKRDDAVRFQAAAQAIVVEMAAPLQTLVVAAEEYAGLAARIQALNNELRAADHNEMCIRPPLHAVTGRDENLAYVFDFLHDGRLLASGVGGPNLLEVAARMRTFLSKKGD
jgi:hypothetical protein